jgi:hypothetical protein
VKIYQLGDRISCYNEDHTAAGEATVVNHDTGPGGTILGYMVALDDGGDTPKQMYVPVANVIETDPDQLALFSADDPMPPTRWMITMHWHDAGLGMHDTGSTDERTEFFHEPDEDAANARAEQIAKAKGAHDWDVELAADEDDDTAAELSLDRYVGAYRDVDC